VPRLDVPQFMAENSSQFPFAGHELDQTAVDENIPPGHGKGIGDRLVDDEETILIGSGSQPFDNPVANRLNIGQDLAILNQ